MFDKIIESIKSNKIIMIVLVAILVYIVLRMFYMGEERIIEGLSTNDPISKSLGKIKKNIDNANSFLDKVSDIDTHKSDYENLIIALDELMDKAVLMKVVDALDSPNAELDPISVITPELMSQINDMVSFKANLESVMDSLDKASASSSSSSIF